MSHHKIFTLLLFLFVMAPVAHAADPAFTQLTPGQANSVIKEFSANFTHTTVSGASALGDVFGVEVGLVAGATKADEIKKLAQQADPNSDVSTLPHGGIIAMASIPFGVTFEASMIPSIGDDDFKFKNFGLGLKWTINSVAELPVSLAVKAHFMKSELNFTQTVSSVTSKVNFDDKVSGLMLLVSKDLVVVEPYFGIGILSGDGSFDVQGTTQFFDSGATSYSSKESGMQLALGLEATLLIFKVGLEYANNFGTNGLNLKLAASF